MLHQHLFQTAIRKLIFENVSSSEGACIILTLNICDGAKQIYPKKKNTLRKDTLQISVAFVRRCIVKKVSLKNLPPVYWHITKIHDIHHIQNFHVIKHLQN